MSDFRLDELMWAKKILDDHLDETHSIDHLRACELWVIISRAIAVREIELLQIEQEIQNEIKTLTGKLTN